MKQIAKVIFAVLGLSITSAAHAGGVNSSAMMISFIVARDSGSHAVFFTITGVPTNVPTDGTCAQTTDRAVIVGTSPGGRAMYQLALAAYLSGKAVIVRTEGCTPLDPSDASQPIAIKMTKIQFVP